MRRVIKIIFLVGAILINIGSIISIGIPQGDLNVWILASLGLGVCINLLFEEFEGRKNK